MNANRTDARFPNPDLGAVAQVDAAPRRRRFLAGFTVLAAALVVGLVLWFLWWPWAQPFPAEPAQDWLAVGDETFARPAPEVASEVAALQQEATAVVRRLLEEFPETAESLDVAAQLHFGFGRVDRAARCWEHCVELDPQFAPAYHAMGSVAESKSELDKAAGYLQQAWDLDPQLPGVSVALADVLIKQGLLDRAQTIVEKSLEKDARFLPSLYQLGEIHLHRKDYAKARKWLEKAIRFGPDLTVAYFGLATACAKLGDAEQAKRHMEKFKALKKKDEQTHRDRLKTAYGQADVQAVAAGIFVAVSHVYLLNDRRVAAEEVLLRGCQIAPDFAESGDALASLYQEQGRAEEALSVLTRTSIASPNSLAVHVHLGELAEQLGRFDEAERAYRRAVALSPQEARAYAMLVNLYLHTNRKLDEARRLAEKAVELDPSVPFCHLLGAVCRRLGDAAGERRALRAVID